MDLKVLNPNKILVINIFGIGDVLFTTPMIRNLKLSLPKAKIGYLCNKRAYAILKDNPDIDKLYVYERDDFKKISDRSKLEYFKALNNFINEIKNDSYDVSIDVSLNSFMSFCTWRAKIVHRIGYDYKGRSMFLTYRKKLQAYENKHVIEYYLDLIKDVGIESEQREMVLNISEDDEKWADAFFKDININSNKTIIGIVPGGGDSWGDEAKFKRWPFENYVKLADKIIENIDAVIILMGGHNEKELCQSVVDGMKHKPFNACGKTTISQFAALSKRCCLNIVNDGGPLHVAVAAKAKTISLFGPVDEKVYGPYPSKDQMVVTRNLVCQPCYRSFRRARCDHMSCLNISVDQVYQKVLKGIL